MPALDGALRRIQKRSTGPALAGSGPWAAVAIAVLGIRVARRMSARDAVVLYRTEVKAGDRFEIVSVAPPSRKARRREAKRQNAAAR